MPGQLQPLVSQPALQHSIADELDVRVGLALGALHQFDDLVQVVPCFPFRDGGDKVREFPCENRNLLLVEDSVAVGVDEAYADGSGEIGRRTEDDMGKQHARIQNETEHSASFVLPFGVDAQIPALLAG